MYNQEAIVDKVIMDELVLQYPELKSIIKKTSPHEVRGGVLSVLDKNKRTEHSIYKFYYELCKKDINMKHMDDMVTHLWNYINSTNVDKEKYGEVMTPKWLVNEMLDTLPKSVWTNKDLKWFDPCNGVGTFPSIIVQRLMKGLENVIPNPKKRYRHIIEEMIYVCELQPKNMYIFHCVFDKQDIYELNTFYGSFLSNEFDEYKKNIWGVDKFDIIIGNPPYNEEFKEDNNRAKNLYNKFIERAIPLCDKLLFVTPSRWLSGGFNLDKFREMMFKRNDIRFINHFPNSDKVFKGTDITGGISYFLIDSKYNGNLLFNDVKCDLGRYDIFVHPKNYSLVDKVITDNNLSTICKSQSYYGFPGNESLFVKEKKENYLKVFVSKNKGNVMWVNTNKIKDKSKLKGYKVFTPAANGENPRFGTKILGKPNEVCSKSYMTLLVNSKEEGESLISYMETKFCNFLLSLRKSTQNMKPDLLKWIPLVPFDRQWTDKQLYKHFNLSQEEINLIESQTK